MPIEIQAEELFEHLIERGFTREQAEKFRAELPHYPPKQREEYMQMLAGVEQEMRTARARENFMDFVREIWPEFIEGMHFEEMAETFQDVERRKDAEGELVDRVIINIGPRHGKTKFTSVYYIAWYVGRHPKHYVIQVGANVDLATINGREVRDLIQTPAYQRIFPGTKISKSAKGAGTWQTTQGGKYFAVGIEGKVVGRGAHLLVIDDPHSEQEKGAAVPSISYDKTYEWYIDGARPRLMSKKSGGGAVLVVMTRWHKEDLTGRLIRDAKNPEKDQWKVIELPAVLYDGTEQARPLWPEFWTMEELMRTKETNSKTWNAQYMQDPTSEEAAIIKREWWYWYPMIEGSTRMLAGDLLEPGVDFPDNRAQISSLFPYPIEYVIQSWDTAMSESKQANFSACTTWGIFYSLTLERKKVSNLILLDSYQERLAFPDLKKKALEKYRMWKPDSCLIELKASGLPLLSELRRLGIPVVGPKEAAVRGQSKTIRVNAIAAVIESGFVWVPRTVWAQELVEQFAEFQGKANDQDDLVDSATYAISRFRNGGLMSLYSDEDQQDNDREKVQARRNAAYYWKTGAA